MRAKIRLGLIGSALVLAAPSALAQGASGGVPRPGTAIAAVETAVPGILTGPIVAPVRPR